jgi:SAM-dependent methyltransferase/rhodanese-related sulfurtransferase
MRSPRPESAQPAALLDVRPSGAYLARRAVDAVNIPLEELTERVHELPPHDRRLLVFDADPARVRQALAALRERGWAGAAAATPDLPLTESGSCPVRLWRPSAFLEEIVGLLQSRAELPKADLRRPRLQARSLKPETEDRKPETPAALDIACGSGRDAAWPALRGFAVTAVDVLPDAIARTRDLARRNGVSVDGRVLDTEKEPLPAGPFELIHVASFLQRDLFEAIRARVAPGGCVVYETFLIAHRDKYGKPRRDAFLLRPGELRGYFADWDVRRYEEGDFTPGRITARLWAVKPGSRD